ncbi:MAG TPA: trypsin-like serine protease [Roseiarcus sp.]|nr:trypsin-like serine protease [Roseiarcus sp.]
MLRALALAASFIALGPAQALVGPAEPDNAFASHIVMVLNRGVDRAGFCSAVVITPRVVLTAAHCIASVDNMRIHYRNEAGDPELGAIEAIAVHPRYHADAAAKRIVSIDLALVRAKTPLPARFSAAELDDSGATSVGERLRIFGYGVAREGDGTSAGVLRGANLATRTPLSSILLWAADPTGGGAGACTGDSGGPIVSGESGKVLAITAWSAGTGHGDRCGGLTQGPLVAPEGQWIDSVLKRWGDR